jgi:hypothetical protein
MIEDGRDIFNIEQMIIFRRLLQLFDVATKINTFDNSGDVRPYPSFVR